MKTTHKPNKEWGKNRKEEARERNMNNADRSLAIAEAVADLADED